MIRYIVGATIWGLLFGIFFFVFLVIAYTPGTDSVAVIGIIEIVCGIGMAANISAYVMSKKNSHNVPSSQPSAAGSAITQLKQRVSDLEKKNSELISELANRSDLSSANRQAPFGNNPDYSSYYNRQISELKQKNEELEKKLNKQSKALEASKEEKNKMKNQIAEDTEKITELESLLSPEQWEFRGINEEISDMAKEVSTLNNDIAQLNEQIAEKRSQLNSLDDQLTFESFGLYTPRFNFVKSEEYLIRLEETRREQKNMISNNTAVLGSTVWTVNGSITQGNKIVKDIQKLVLRAFNGECDELVSKIKYNNFEASLKRINSSCDAISKLGASMNISISYSYRQAKINELTLAFEYAQKKQQEKEAEKDARAILREEARLQKEIEDERRRLEKEQTHYQNALYKINSQLAQNPDNEELQTRQHTLIEKIEDTEKALKDVDYREANKRAGYVYVISNVGAFGENVYKIGMTRRLNPQDRVDELGDASVPFRFDVHAMIFSDDAPALEAALHRAFEDKKINMVNPRREFFRVSLDEIKAVVRQNYDKTVEFTDIPDAEQWRISVKMRGETEEQAVPQIPTPTTVLTETSAPPPVKNLAETAIDLIHTKYPRAECTYIEENGIYAVTIKDRGILRISNYKRVKCDFRSKDGSTVFFGDLDKLQIFI